MLTLSHFYLANPEITSTLSQSVNILTHLAQLHKVPVIDFDIVFCAMFVK